MNRGIILENINDKQKTLIRTLKANGASLVGFADVRTFNSELCTEYPVSISIAIKYDEKIVENIHMDEQSFHEHLLDLRDRMDNLLKIAAGLLFNWKYKYEVLPQSIHIKDNLQLKELKTFSHKTAATSAGLGWIGKSTLLITPEYGPGIRLATVLTDAKFRTGTPVVSGKCGKCDLCVKACPYNAILNKNWDSSVERDSMINVYICNEKRLEMGKSIDRKHNCSLCLQACRVGKEDNFKKTGG
jgi:epoxyqueuosine reductase QueG